MIDLGKYTYKDKPYTQVKQYAIHPLSDQGFYEYLSKDSNSRKYLNRIDPRILEEMDQEERNEEIRRLYQQAGRIETPQDVQVSDHQHNMKENQHRFEDKIKDCFRINDMPEENEEQEISLPKKRAQTSHNFHRPQLHQTSNNRSNLQSAVSKQRDYNPILMQSNHLNRIGNSTSQGFFSKNGKRDKSKQTASRFNPKYLAEMEKLASSTSSGFKVTSGRKNYDGFESYRVPRLKKRSNSEFKGASFVNNYSKQMINSLRKNENTTDEYINLNQLCEEENTKLRTILSNQSNDNFLAKSKLPKIAYIVNQPKFLLSNTRQQYSKNLGEKYNPFNYKFDHKTNYKRNINGGHFLY